MSFGFALNTRLELVFPDKDHDKHPGPSTPSTAITSPIAPPNPARRLRRRLNTPPSSARSILTLRLSPQPHPASEDTPHAPPDPSDPPPPSMSATPDPQPAHDGGSNHDDHHEPEMLNGRSEALAGAKPSFEPMDEGEEFGDFRDAHDDDDAERKSIAANDRMLELLEEAREEMAEERADEENAGNLENGTGFKKFQRTNTESVDHADEDLPAGGEGSEGVGSPAPPSSVGSFSNPDDTPSAQVRESFRKLVDWADVVDTGIYGIFFARR